MLGGLEKQRASMAGKEDWSWQRTGVGEKLFAGKTGKAACEYGRAKDWSWMEVCRTKGAEKNAKTDSAEKEVCRVPNARMSSASLVEMRTEEKKCAEYLFARE